MKFEVKIINRETNQEIATHGFKRKSDATRFMNLVNAGKSTIVSPIFKAEMVQG